MKRFLLSAIAVLLILCVFSGCDNHPDASSTTAPVSATQPAPSSSGLSDTLYTAPDESYSLRVLAGWEPSEEDEILSFKGPDYASTGNGLSIGIVNEPFDDFSPEKLVKIFSDVPEFEKNLRRRTDHRREEGSALSI